MPKLPKLLSTVLNSNAYAASSRLNFLSFLRVIRHLEALIAIQWHCLVA